MKKRSMHGDHSTHEEHCHCNHISNGACGGGVYFFGFIGSVIYYIQQAPNFWQGVLGVLKAIVWPAFLVYKLLG